MGVACGCCCFFSGSHVVVSLSYLKSILANIHVFVGWSVVLGPALLRIEALGLSASSHATSTSN